EERREDAAAGFLVPFTGRIQVLAQIPGPFPGPDEFRGERVVQFSGQHLLLLSAHWTSRSLWIVNAPAAESRSRTSALPPAVSQRAPPLWLVLGAAWRSPPEYFIWMPKKGPQPRLTPPGNRWFVYLLRCADGSLYTGITKDVDRRCQQHNAGTASRYTRSRLPVVVVYREAHASRSLAWRREAAVKALSRGQQEGLL